MEQSLFHSKTAVIVVDMLNDFVKGKLSCEQSRAIVPPIRALLSHAAKEYLFFIVMTITFRTSTLS